MRLIQRDPLDPLHRKKQSRQADALPVGIQHLTDEIVEGIQVDAAQGHAGRIYGRERSPQFLLGCMQAQDDD